MRSALRPRKNGKSKQARTRRGATLVLAALLLVVLMGMLAMSIDVGYIAAVKTELKRATDAGALAGAGALVNGSNAASEQVYQFISQNSVGGKTIANDDVTIELGHWDENALSFTASNELPSAIKVQVNLQQQPLFFARVLGQNSFSLSDESIAMYQPRDIMLVLDYSGSMNDDSELKSEGTMGADFIEENMQTIYDELGSPAYGSMQWDQTLSSSWSNWQVRNYLGLNSVAYPYPSGSWSEYVDYVKDDYGNIPNDYRHHYGYKTLINYWMEQRESYSETPDLWQVSEQPITALKNAVEVFLAYLQEVDTDDRVGLSIYTSSSGGGYLESELTQDFQEVEDTSRQRQAGHYQSYTNIGAGMVVAQDELEDHARAGAFKMMVLITDGIANRPNNTTDAKAYALTQAQNAADANIPVVTISLGSGADTDLMQQIADLTGGVHFNVPGGQPVADYEEDLKDVFRQIADDRPLKLVK